jgi:hypothetical protein
MVVEHLSKTFLVKVLFEAYLEVGYPLSSRMLLFVSSFPLRVLNCETSFIYLANNSRDLIVLLCLQVNLTLHIVIGLNAKALLTILYTRISLLGLHGILCLKFHAFIRLRMN